MTIEVSRYTPDDAHKWNAFCSQSANATFLHNRNYMDYHSDRFTDHSLMFFDGKENLVAVLPASEHEKHKEIKSHGGLTYGGLIVKPKLGQELVLSIFDQIKSHYKQAGFKTLVYKPVPHIYHRHLVEDDIYALFRNNAICTRVDCSTTITLETPLPVSSLRKRMAKKATKQGCHVVESYDFEAYFKILASRLEEKYDAQPVHTPNEMRNLQAKFPENIKLFAAFKGEQMLAGTVVYDCGKCVHTQYLASSDEGLECGALDMALLETIKTYRNRTYFDFGISNENDGKYLNTGLKKQKEMFGGQTVVYQLYQLNL